MRARRISDTQWLMWRIQSAKENRIRRDGRPLTSEERIALTFQKARFAELLARLPVPRLP